MKVGIDAIDFHVPKIYLPISALAEARNIEYAKLNKGLGLQSMSIPDVNEDVATMAAQAVINLIENEGIALSEIGRLYLGTESALDAAKPTATYVMQMVEAHFKQPRALKNCDVVDMTFACVGAVDALHNSLDWIRQNPERKAIVVAADNAKYELSSGGEYTQGAGAVALLLSSNPSILAIDEELGVATESVGDFFKPRREYTKVKLLERAAKLLGQNLSSEDLKNLLSAADDDFWGHSGASIEIHRDEPVFDGPYSNDCYTLRITEALEHLSTQKEVNVLNDWSQLIFHLPYAFQGRRMIAPLWVEWMAAHGKVQELEESTGLSMPSNDSPDYADFVKACSKTPIYKTFVKSHIEKGERASSDIGNMYTASIFMSLLSYLSAAAEEGNDLNNQQIGFMSYGSGSKSKVFTGTVQNGWKAKTEALQLFEVLASRKAIDFETYEKIHNGELKQPILANTPALKELGQEPTNAGLRFYEV